MLLLLLTPAGAATAVTPTQKTEDPPRLCEETAVRQRRRQQKEVVLTRCQGRVPVPVARRRGPVESTAVTASAGAASEIVGGRRWRATSRRGDTAEEDVPWRKAVLPSRRGSAEAAAFSPCWRLGRAAAGWSGERQTLPGGCEEAADPGGAAVHCGVCVGFVVGRVLYEAFAGMEASTHAPLGNSPVFRSTAKVQVMVDCFVGATGMLNLSEGLCDRSLSEETTPQPVTPECDATEPASLHGGGGGTNHTILRRRNSMFRKKA